MFGIQSVSRVNVRWVFITAGILVAVLFISAAFVVLIGGFPTHRVEHRFIRAVGIVDLDVHILVAGAIKAGKIPEVEDDFGTFAL